MKAFLSFLSPNMPYLLVYMLQQFEYDHKKFGSWLLRVKDLRAVKTRGKMTLTNRAKLMLAVAYLICLLGILLSVCLIWTFGSWQILVGSFLLLQISSVIGLVLYCTTVTLHKLVVSPNQNKEIKRAKAELETMDVPKIAIIGSYGKTSMKEMLTTIIGQEKLVAATPGNKNVIVSHARWVNHHLSGREDVLIFEYGEAQQGDIKKLAAFSKPTHAVITGLAPAHLDYYPNLEAVAEDFADINKQVPKAHVYFNAESELLKNKIDGQGYTKMGLDGWKVSAAKVSFDGTKFTMTKGKQVLKLHTGLLGLHHIGPLVVAVILALELGLSQEQIIEGVAETKPYVHRMQPRNLHGAWIIDDTYNGNIEGMRAGLELLKSLPAKRKIYVTPGLVDQGVETEAVHNELGKLIAAAQPNEVVLMKNSVTGLIKTGLGDYSGKLRIESNPLEYYTNLEHFLAAGDLVLLQNDWPDSYN